MGRADGRSKSERRPTCQRRRSIKRASIRRRSAGDEFGYHQSIAKGLDWVQAALQSGDCTEREPTRTGGTARSF